MAETFKTCMFGGFDRQNVVDYIEKLSKDNRERIEALQAEIAAKELESSGLRLKNDEMAGELTLLRKVAKEAELTKNQLLDLSAELEKLRTDLAASETENEALRTEYENNLRAAHDTLAEKETENRELHLKNDDMSAELGALRTMAEEAELINLQNQDLGAEVERLRAALAEAEDANESLAAENESLGTESEDLTAENETLRTESKALRAENETVRTENETLGAENETLRAENEALHAENETLGAENETLGAENETLRAENETLRAENETLRAENETLRAENETVRTENEEYQAMKDHITDIELQANRDAENLRTATIGELKEAIGHQRAWNEQARRAFAQMNDGLLQNLRDLENTLTDVDLSGFDRAAQELQDLEESFDL